MLRKFLLNIFHLSGKLRLVSGIIVYKDDEFLIVKKPRKRHAWQFPQGGKEAGESSIETAQRELEEECGKGLRVELLEKPIGDYSYFFPKEFKRHRPGIKGVFVTFYKAKYLEGDIEIDKDELIDFKWIKKDEFLKYFEGEYLETVEKFVYNGEEQNEE